MPIATRPAAKPAATPAKPAVTRAAPATTAKPATVAKAAEVVQPSAIEHPAEQTITVTKTLLENGTIKGVPVTEESIEVRMFATAHATTAFGTKFRKNLGNYESVEVSVFASMPCYVEEFDSVRDQTIEKVQATFNEVMTSLDIEEFRSEVTGSADFSGGQEGAVEAEAGAEGAAEAEADGLTVEWIDAASREELEALVAENPIEGVDPADFAEDEDLRSVVKDAFFPDEGGEAAADAPAEDAPYTEEELMGSSLEELVALYAAWDMGKFPAYNARTQAAIKKQAVAKILKKQDENAA